MTDTLSLDRLITDLAAAFKAVDASAPQGRSTTRTYKPGIGPLPEADAIKRALDHLKQTDLDTYATATPAPYPGSRQLCDIVITGQWAIEAKLIRPFGDNGAPAEHWSENILHPYPGNTSSLGDAYKLLESNFPERKAIIVFGYEHSPPRIPLEPAVRSFETIATQVLDLSLGLRREAHFTDLIHPYHQQGTVYGRELLKS